MFVLVTNEVQNQRGGTKQIVEIAASATANALLLG
jgi:hypothetical protein